MWSGVSFTNSNINTSWPINARNTYYFLLVIAGSTLISHIEEDVAEKDIKEGKLVSYLLKPYSYFWHKFFLEIPYRLLQGFFGVIIFIITSMIGTSFIFSSDTIVILLSLIVIILALFVGFTYKMIIGLWAFWFLDIWGVYQVTEVCMLIFAGFVLPLDLYPDWLKTVSLLTPFPYMIYFPIMSIQGKFVIYELLNIIGRQLLWLGILKFLYSLFWNKGLKKFTGVGQ
jgi:ABC-2 type transport system permease protein